MGRMKEMFEELRQREINEMIGFRNYTEYLNHKYAPQLKDKKKFEDKKELIK